MNANGQIVLADPGLLRSQCLIDGEWIDARSAETLAVCDPSNGATIARVTNASQIEAGGAIDAAEAAFATWRHADPSERSRILRAWGELVEEHREDLASLLVTEQGKPMNEARGEIDYARGFIDWFAEEARRIYGDVIPTAPGRRLFVEKHPIGVVAAITPWNFPAAMITRKVAAAIAAGCTVVLKPSELTPLTALALGELAVRAELPRGVLNIVTGMPEAIGAELTSDPRVRKLTFTGSTKVGKLLAEKCATTLKRLSLELGGNAPFLIFEDADIEPAIDAVMQSKFRNTGQTCVCANRIYVHDAIHDEFLTGLCAKVESLRIGSGFDERSTQGPLINKAAVEKASRLVEDALRNGASIAFQHDCSPLKNLGTWFPPTIVTGAHEEMAIAKEEIFGPVAVLYRFSDDATAIESANGSASGLASYVATRSPARMLTLASQLEFGMIGINTGQISDPVAPFGGIKESGYGREGSKYGIEEYLDLRTVAIAGLPLPTKLGDDQDCVSALANHGTTRRG